MSKRRSSRKPPQQAPAPAAPAARRWQRWGWLSALVLVAAAVGAAMFLAGRASTLGDVSFPAPREPAPAHLVSRADFVGAKRCADCHQAEYAAWARSTHGRAGGLPAADVVIAAFDGRPIRFRDAIVRPRIIDGGRYVFVVEQEDSAPLTFGVDGVIGGGHMAGGGTQGFVSRRPDGTWRFIPFDFSRQAGRWFCNSNTRLGKGWVPITPDMPLSACGDWPFTRVLGDVPRFANCQGCHGSQIEAHFDTTTHQYETGIASLAINCESCHGPGRRHVELVASGTMSGRADIGMRALATLDKDQSLRVCYQCHAVKDQLRPGYLPGDSLERFYSAGLTALGERPLNPDGRVRTFAYQENQRSSECYRKGGMRCVDCHDPHSQSYRDVNGTALPGRLDDRQCTSCHASKADQVESHTHHRASSPGSRCVSCHMPYLQHPEVGGAIPFARSDHTIPIPRPAFDSASGVMPACSSCHAGVPAAVLQAQVTAWSPRPAKPLAPSVAALVAAGRGTLGADAARALLVDDGHQMARVAALARLVEALASGDQGWLDDAMEKRLREVSAERDADVAALALATLHLGRGGDRGTRRFLARTLSRAGGHDGALRDRWSLVLGYVGDRLAAEGRHDDAIAAYRKALEVSPSSAPLLTNLANAERDGARDGTQLASAIANYRRSLRLDPASSLSLVNLGIAQATSGDTAAALASWRDAMRMNPGEPLARFNLGNALLLGGHFAEAAAAYRATIALDAGIAPAHFNLARALAAAGQYGEALRALQGGLRVDSTDAGARAMAAQLREMGVRR